MSDPIHQPPRFGRLGPQDGGLQPLRTYLEQERRRWRPFLAVDLAGPAPDPVVGLIIRDPNPTTYADPAAATGYQVETVLVPIDPVPDPWAVAQATRAAVEEALVQAKRLATDALELDLTRMYLRQV